MDNTRHYKTEEDRANEVKTIDDWILNEEGEVSISFKDNKGVLHKNVKVDTLNMGTHYKGRGKGYWRSYIWNFPTEFGIVYIKPLTSRTFIIVDGKGYDIDKTKVSVTIQ